MGLRMMSIRQLPVRSLRALIRLSTCPSSIRLCIVVPTPVGLTNSFVLYHNFCFRVWVEIKVDAITINKIFVHPWHWGCARGILIGSILWGLPMSILLFRELPLCDSLWTSICQKLRLNFALPLSLLRQWLFAAPMSFLCFAIFVLNPYPSVGTLRGSVHRSVLILLKPWHCPFPCVLHWIFCMRLVGLQCLSDPSCVFGCPCSVLHRLRLLMVWTFCSVCVLGVHDFPYLVASQRFVGVFSCFKRFLGFASPCPFRWQCLPLLALCPPSCLILLTFCRISITCLCCSFDLMRFLSRFCLFLVWISLFVDPHPFRFSWPHIAQVRALRFLSCMISLGCMPKIIFRNTRDLFSFDHTCGFPGEGPFWSCISANVNSVNSHPDCLYWKDDLVCLQETRLSQSSIEQHRFQLLSSGRDFFYAKLLQASRQKNGIKHIPHGGTACIASKDLCRAFSSDDDSTGLWQGLAESTRVSAVWVQILPRLKLLAFSFYGQATMNGISSHDINNHYLEKIFTICAQFGNIPCIICGDFQDDPDSFPSVQQAKSYAEWCDPISKTLDDGSQSRPITYSRNSDFVSPTDNFSSIDGILLNGVAASALTSIEVLHTNARQHAPIRACFKWDRVFQKGYTLVKPASLDLSKLPMSDGKIDQDKLEASAHRLWQEKFSKKCSQKDDEKAWKSINEFAIQTLCEQGATFKKGPRARGKPPLLKPHVACPGQDRFGVAFTNESSKLSKLHRLITELRLRFQRSATNTADFNITMKLQNRVASTLKSTRGFEWWNNDLHLSCDALQRVQKSLQQKIETLRQKEKRARISAWQQKMIAATRSKQVDKCVYQWIQGKTRASTPNLILNSKGDIILAPTEAIAEINDQWDSIFASNIHHEDPEKVLAVVWPYVQNSYSKIELPPISACDLKIQLARRKANAAPGLDGWRTVEAQSLPLKVLSAVADFFNDVERGNRSLPQSLTMAKQIILDKGSEDLPLSKRLISLLSVLLLSYTGLRFRQLQTWQNQCLPMQLYGGIKNRRMSSVFSKMQLQIDSTVATHDNLIGLKLDKSKCFDRLVPSIVASLFVAFGLPIGLTKFFLQIYQGLKRFMCYKQWISTRPTTAPNGLVQGCSLSLLAINLQMSVWTMMLRKLTEIQAAVFIDDSYLWTNAIHLSLLQQAVDITHEWDAVVGQTLNMRKCQIWATSSKHRSKLRECFPTMKLVLNLEVLGATVHTADISKTDWPSKKTTKILRDIQLIKAIPCSRSVQEHLISVKVIPQLSFAANMNGIPKKVLASFQNAVTDGLWRGRPMWRSKGLLLAIIADPSKSDPICARAVTSIVETIDFLKTADAYHREAWQTQHGNDIVRHNSMIQQFYQAANVLGIEMCGAFHFSLWNATPVSFLDLAKRDTKKILKIAARDMCYKTASHTSRKDIFPAVNVLDFFATSLANKECKNQWHKNLPLQCHRDASIVGSCITNDRRFAAGLSDTEMRRFCHSTKESFAHLAHECQSLPFPTRPFCNPSKGPNFGNLGIVETSFVQAQKRLQISSVSSIVVESWNHLAYHNHRHVWSDGSCCETQNFWYTIGGFFGCF